MKTNFGNTPVALANENYDVRGEAGTFSAETKDAVASAHVASAKAHEAGTAEAHERAARLHRLAGKRHVEEGSEAEAQLHEGIASGHDAMAIHCAATTPEEKTFPALENADAAIDDDGWCLIAPFGRWPKTYQYAEDGVAKVKKFIQALDNESADALVGKENSFFGRLKRALIGVPVYKLHGDVKDVDPKSLANSAEKIKVGVVDQIRKSGRGIEAHFALDNDGAEAVKDGYKFPSAYWWVLPVGLENDSIIAKPFKLISVALTQFPNISGVESLANSGDRLSLTATTDEQKQKIKTEPDMKMIAGWLIANGVALANTGEPTEIQVLDGLKTLFTSKAGEVTALANEKSQLTGITSNFRRKAATFAVDCALLGGRLPATERDNKILALENAKDFDAEVNAILSGKIVDKVTALENDITLARQQRAELAVDLIIQRGKLSVAQRNDTITALANAADFTAEFKKLSEAANVVKTGADFAGNKQVSALENEATALANEYKKAIDAELPEAGHNISEAHRRVMTLPKWSALALKLAPKAN